MFNKEFFKIVFKNIFNNIYVAIGDSFIFFSEGVCNDGKLDRTESNRVGSFLALPVLIFIIKRIFENHPNLITHPYKWHQSGRICLLGIFSTDYDTSYGLNFIK